MNNCFSSYQKKDMLNRYSNVEVFSKILKLIVAAFPQHWLVLSLH